MWEKDLQVKCAEQLCPENSPAPIQGKSDVPLNMREQRAMASNLLAMFNCHKVFFDVTHMACLSLIFSRCFQI